MGRYPPFLLPHLLECVSEIECTDFLVVLEFEELVPTMTSHIYKNVAPLISEKSFGPWGITLHTA